MAVYIQSYHLHSYCQGHRRGGGVFVVLEHPISLASYARLCMKSIDPAKHTDLALDPAISS